MNEELSSNYIKFGDVTYNQDIIPVDENGNPQKLVPLGGFLDLFKKTESNSSNVYINGEKNDLSIVQLAADDYYKMIVNDEVDAKTLYVLSSNNINAYGQVVANVATPVEDDDAATKKYVDSTLSAAKAKISNLQALTQDNVTSTKVLNTVNQIIDILKSL